MRLERIVPISFALILGTSSAHAQTPPDAPKTIAIGDFTLAPTLELRTRAEYRHDPVDMGGLDAAGQPTSRVRDPWLIFERTRVLQIETDATQELRTQEAWHEAGGIRFEGYPEK